MPTVPSSGDQSYDREKEIGESTTRSRCLVIRLTGGLLAGCFLVRVEIILLRTDEQIRVGSGSRKECQRGIIYHFSQTPTIIAELIMLFRGT